MRIFISCCACISNEGIWWTSIKQEECRFSSSKEGYVLEGLWSSEMGKIGKNWWIRTKPHGVKKQADTQSFHRASSFFCQQNSPCSGIFNCGVAGEKLWSKRFSDFVHLSKSDE